MMPERQVAMMVLVCLAISPVPVSAQTAQTKGFAIEFAGGNAFVFSDDNKQVDIGAVARPSSAAETQFNDHPMQLVLKSGSVEKLESAAMLPRGMDASDGSPTWALKNLEVWFRPDKVAQENSNLKTSKETPDETCEPKDESDNSFYVPNLLALHKTAKLVKDWRNRLESRIVLRSGTLTVARARDCFTFSTQRTKESVRKQSIAHSKAAVRYNVEFHEFVDMVLKAPDGTGKEFAVLRFRPSKGNCMVWLSVEPPDTEGKPHTHTDLQPGQEITHFQQFYELIDLKEDRLKLFYTPRDGKERTRTPGSECPTARFGG